ILFRLTKVLTLGQSRSSNGPKDVRNPDALDSAEACSRLSSDRAFLALSLGLLIAVSAVFVYYRWDDLGNGDVRTYAFGAVDFISHPKLYDRVYLDKPPLALLMYFPVVLFPPIPGQAIFFAIVIVVEALLLRWLLLELGFTEAACLGGI